MFGANNVLGAEHFLVPIIKLIDFELAEELRSNPAGDVSRSSSEDSYFSQVRRSEEERRQEALINYDQKLNLERYVREERNTATRLRLQVGRPGYFGEPNPLYVHVISMLPEFH